VELIFDIFWKTIKSINVIIIRTTHQLCHDGYKDGGRRHVAGEAGHDGSHEHHQHADHPRLKILERTQLCANHFR